MSLFCASGNLEENSFFPRPPGELESKDTLSSLDVPPLWSMSKALKAGGCDRLEGRRVKESCARMTSSLGLLRPAWPKGEGIVRKSAGQFLHKNY